MWAKIALTAAITGGVCLDGTAEPTVRMNCIRRRCQDAPENCCHTGAFNPARVSEIARCGPANHVP